jgi:hypothetical protein
MSDFRVNAHIDAWRRRRRFDVGRVLGFNNPPATYGSAGLPLMNSAAYCGLLGATLTWCRDQTIFRWVSCTFQLYTVRPPLL